MDKAAAIESLKKFRRSVENQGVRVDQIILFGSHVHGNARPDSDIDTVVISEDFQDKTLWERCNILSVAILDSHALIEAVAVTPDEWENDNLTIREYAKDGEIIAA